jgi:hypothetical protein
MIEFSSFFRHFVSFNKLMTQNAEIFVVNKNVLILCNMYGRSVRYDPMCI